MYNVFCLICLCVYIRFYLCYEIPSNLGTTQNLPKLARDLLRDILNRDSLGDYLGYGLSKTCINLGEHLGYGINLMVI
jgi:hypothetical protein